MAKYVLLDENYNMMGKLVDNDTSKNYWVNLDNVSKAITLSDTDYEDVIRGNKGFDSNTSSAVTISTGTQASEDFTQERVQNEINQLVQDIDLAIATYANAPSQWTTAKNALQAIDLSSITWPVNARTWVDALMKNSINVPSAREF